MKKLKLCSVIGILVGLMLNPNTAYCFVDCVVDYDCLDGWLCVNQACCEYDLAMNDPSMCPNGPDPGGGGSCSGCNNCTNVAWTNFGTGYQRYITKTCDCNTCNSKYSYRCAANYYGTSTNGYSGCTACPDGGSSSPGATLITECYQTSGKTGSDSSGSWTLTSSCYYTK